MEADEPEPIDEVAHQPEPIDEVPRVGRLRDVPDATPPFWASSHYTVESLASARRPSSARTSPRPEPLMLTKQYVGILEDGSLGISTSRSRVSTRHQALWERDHAAEHPQPAVLDPQAAMAAAVHEAARTRLPAHEAQMPPVLNVPVVHSVFVPRAFVLGEPRQPTERPRSANRRPRTPGSGAHPSPRHQALPGWKLTAAPPPRRPGAKVRPNEGAGGGLFRVPADEAARRRYDAPLSHSPSPPPSARDRPRLSSPRPPETPGAAPPHEADADEAAEWYDDVGALTLEPAPVPYVAKPMTKVAAIVAHSAARSKHAWSGTIVLDEAAAHGATTPPPAKAKAAPAAVAVRTMSTARPHSASSSRHAGWAPSPMAAQGLSPMASRGVLRSPPRQRHAGSARVAGRSTGHGQRERAGTRRPSDSSAEEDELYLAFLRMREDAQRMTYGGARRPARAASAGHMRRPSQQRWRV